MFNLNSNNHGSYKNYEGSRKRTSSKKKEINYVRALDKEGNPILINKEDLAQVVGELSLLRTSRMQRENQGEMPKEVNSSPTTCARSSLLIKIGLPSLSKART